MPLREFAPSSKATTGIKGLDEILSGGLPRGELHTLRGGPGTGKTTIGLQFLIEGASKGEKTVFITLSQTEDAVRKIAASHGWPLDGIDIRERRDLEELSGPVEQTLFRTADVELEETTSAIFREIERLDAARVVLDSMAQIRLLAGSRLRYQNEILAFRDFFSGRLSTILVMDGSGDVADDTLADLSHGVIVLERSVPDYGNVRRRLNVVKMRGMSFHGGHHNFRISAGGLEVYPRLEPSGDGIYELKLVESGDAGLDLLLGGGLEEGTACLLIGATGTGKTSVATLYAHAAALRGERAAIFCFDERLATFLKRSEGLGMDMRPLLDEGLVTLRAISTAELSPGEFAQTVREAVEEDQAKIVIMDSLTGYFHAMPQEEALLSQMHDLLTYLGQKGVLSLLVVSQHGMVGDTVQGPIDVSYMADTVILLRHFEAAGRVRKAISVIKKRQGPHETAIRELQFSPGRLEIGEPLQEFTGILSGRPVFHGRSEDSFATGRSRP